MSVARAGIAGAVDRAVARLRRAPVDLALLPEGGVPGSIFSGAAGVAFFLYEAARLRGEDDLVDLASAWSAAARGWADRARVADWRGSANGFLVGGVGLAFVEALLGARRGDAKAVLCALERVDRASTSRRGYLAGVARTELFAGRAGIACAALGLDARLGTAATRALVARVRERAAASLDAAEADDPDRAPARARDRVGMAHGLAGEAWALAALFGPEHEVVRRRLAELAALAETDVNGLPYWPARRASTDMSHAATFCNGVPGHSLLLTEIARRTRTKAAMASARRAAESVAALAGGVPTLCCGLAGQSIVLERYADLSGDARFRRLARACLARATRARLPTTALTTPVGLFQGGLGIALVAMSRLAGERAFPCLEPPLSVQGAHGYRKSAS